MKRSNYKTEKYKLSRACARAWNKDHTTIDIFDKDGVVYAPDANEVFVPLFNCKAGLTDERYLISDKDNLISFVKPNKPQLISMRLDHPDDEKNAYVIFGGGKETERLNRAVYFSFMAYAIRTKKAKPYHYNVEINSIHDLKRIAKNSSLYNVHHIDDNRKNNRLENLELLDVETHRLFNTLKEAGELKKLNILREKLSGKAVLFFEPIDDTGKTRISIHNYGKVSFRDSKEILDLIAKNRASGIIQDVIRLGGLSSFIKEKSICVLVRYEGEFQTYGFRAKLNDVEKKIILTRIDLSKEKEITYDYISNEEGY